MQQSLHFRPQFLLSNPHLVSHLNGFRGLSLLNIHAIAFEIRIQRCPFLYGHSDLSGIDLRSKSPFFFDCPKRALAISARKTRRRNGWRISGKTALSRALFVASSLKLFPEPIDFLIREGFGGGDEGGGFGSFDGFGWGGFDGWGRRRKRKLGFFVLMLFLLLVVFGLFLLSGSRKEFERFSDLGFGVLLGLLLLGNVEGQWQREFKGWILGFCSCALMVFLGLKRDELQKWVQRLSVSLPVKRLLGRRRRRKFL